MSRKNKIKLLKISSELGAGTRGASKGFEGLKTAAKIKGSNLFDEFEVISIKDENESLLKNINFPNAKRIKQIHEVLLRVHNEVKKQLKQNKLPILISGDHSIAAGTIAGIKSAYPSKIIGVVWDDFEKNDNKSNNFTKPSHRRASRVSILAKVVAKTPIWRLLICLCSGNFR